jgi:hypothetical protein
MKPTRMNRPAVGEEMSRQNTSRLKLKNFCVCHAVVISALDYSDAKAF